jgi:hypothetical protein
MIAYLHDKVAEHVKHIGNFGRTLEIGSFDVNGGVADLFENYTGTDMRAGPGVDVVVNSHDIVDVFGPRRFDTIVWLESAEHDEAFWLTMENINQLIKPAGYLIVSAPTISYPNHMFPEDFWRFTVEGMFTLLGGWEVLVIEELHGETICALAQHVANPRKALVVAQKRIRDLERKLDYMVDRQLIVKGIGGVIHG